MRYYRRLGPLRIALWLGYGLIVAVSLFNSTRSFWIASLSAVLVVLLSYGPYLYWYWEILPDRLVHRQYFQQTVFPFSEIEYVGPTTGRMADFAATRTWIEIRNRNGKRMLAQPADPAAFLNHLRKYLPQATLNL